jgi:hypothetical protein
MPELPVKDLRPSELHLPEINREDIVRTLSERLPSVDLSAIQLPGRNRQEGTRFDWRSIDPTEALAGLAAVSRIGRPLVRRWRWGLAAGVVVAVGIATAAVLANQDVRDRAGRTVGKLRDKARTRMDRSDVLEIDDDVEGQVLPESLDAVVSVADDATTPVFEPPDAEAPADAVPAFEPSDLPDEAPRPA